MTNSYQLIDAGDFRKLEQVGPYKIVRPSPQAVWRPVQSQSVWQDSIAAEFVRHSSGDGQWKIFDKTIHRPFNIQIAGITFIIKLTDFGHLGIFAEQSLNWRRLQQLCKGSKRDLKILNLFAYTGGSTLACAAGGAEVVHLDASKTSVAWARENATASGLDAQPVRWIVDDVKKFVTREIRRQNKYDGIILDPPSYGRGSKNEVWKIETDLPDLLDNLDQLLSAEWKFVLLSSHSAGYTPIAQRNLLAQMSNVKDCDFVTEEMVQEATSGKSMLPSGSGCWALNGCGF